MAELAPDGELPVGRSVTVEVPATSANLGPGFDCLGLALSWRDRCQLEVVPDGWSAEVSGEGAGNLPTGADHLVLSAARHALDQLGCRVPGLALRARNTIPHGRGLGSSSAAIAAGLIGAAGLSGRSDALDPDHWIDLATRIEGHPDNVAAALYGGVVLAYTEHGSIRIARIPVHPSIRAIAFVPDRPLSTHQARGLLPTDVPHPAAAANAARAALLVHALSTDPSLIFDATLDWLHQEYRSPAMPESAELLRSLRAKGYAAVISGAGPSVLVLGEERDLGNADTALEQSSTEDFRVVPLSIGPGARLVESPGVR